MVFIKLKNRQYTNKKFLNDNTVNGNLDDNYFGKKLNNFQEITNFSDRQVNVWKQLLYMIFGFLMSVTNICGEISPLGVSVCATASSQSFLATSLGAFLGYIVSRGDNMIYVISIFLIIMIKWFFENSQYISAPLMTFVALFSSALIFVLISDSISFYNVLIILCESIMASGSAFFFCNAKKILNKKIHYKGLNNNELAILSICFLIMLVPLMSVTIKYVSVGKIIAIYAILFVALNMEAYGSAIVGILVGLAILLNAEQQNSYMIISYSICGLLAGMARKYKALGVTAVFVVTNGFVTVFSCFFNHQNIFPYFLELLFSSVLFLTTSLVVSRKISLTKNNEIETLSCENVKNLMLLKLSFASSTLHDIALTTQQVSSKLSKSSQPTIEGIYHRCATEICNNCNLKMFCWNAAYNDVVDSFNNMTGTLKQNGRITDSDISVFMRQKCKNVNEIITNVNQNYNRFITQKGVNRKVEEIREVVTDQFDGMAIMLNDLAKEFYEINKFDKQTSIKARKVLTNMGFDVSAITSFFDKYGRLTIEAKTNVVKDIGCVGEAVALELSDVCDRNLGLPSFTRLNKNMKLTITEKANYEIDFGATQLSCNNFKHCGDAYNYFVDSKGRAYMILSDGMGTGSRAAIDGNMTAGLLSKLIKAGFEFESALKIVNSALLVKSGDESLSTIDVTSVDLYTGQTNMFKVGSAPTFTKKSDKIIKTDCSSLPAGILRGISFDKKTIVLKNKDIIVMVSDGVTNGDYDWIYDEINNFKYNINAKEFSRKIALESKFKNQSSHDDDVTVLVGIITKGV